jgi:RimJ/RimL family protein N-acetyltransferase
MTNWLPDTIALDGENVVLLPLQESHFDALYDAASNPEIWELTSVNYSDPVIFHQSNTTALKDKEKGTVYPFVIVDKQTDTIIGTTRFLEISAADKKLEIGVTWIKKEFWGSTVNMECKYLLLEYCFEHLQLHRVQFRAKADNLRSRKAIEKIGGQLEGVFRKDKIEPNGNYRNTAFYSIIDTEWKDTKAMLVAQLARSKSQRK